MGLRQASELAGLPYRTAAYWVEQGLIHLPGYQPWAWKQGRRIPWTDSATIELVNLARLRGMLSLQALRRAGEFLRVVLRQNPFSSGEFMVVGDRNGQRELVKLCEGEEAIALLREPGQRIFIALWAPGGEDAKQV